MLEDDILMDENDILERVDEYTLYCHYLQFAPDIGMKYTSPIRPDDDDPSFGIFPSKYIPNREYLWKDQAKGVHGDVFKLICLILEYTYGECSRFQMLARIKSDFGLGPAIIDSPPIRVHNYTPKPRDPIDITVKTRGMDAADLRFWKQFNIKEELLTLYKVRALQYYWTYKAQSIPKFPNGLAYAYHITPKYKLYFPHQRKEFKFRNDLTYKELEGFAQLRYDQDLCIITKSYKDVMCLRSFGYEAVAPRSESILIAPEYMTYLEQRYKRMFILFDNDGKHKADEYKAPKIWVPKESGEKDITDFCKRYGAQSTAELLKQLVWQST
jgi:hypothetical protein